MALLPTELVESFAILDALIDCEYHNTWHLHLTLTCVHDCHSSFRCRLRSSL